jgi:P-type E1-E2 ATPase
MCGLILVYVYSVVCICAQATTICSDKTGTLTSGKMTVVKVCAAYADVC